MRDIDGWPNLEITITRQIIEELANPMFDNQISLMHKALQYAEIEKDEIDEVLLFGGSSRILSVKSRL